jgi:hypothetical protein
VCFSLFFRLQVREASSLNQLPHPVQQQQQWIQKLPWVVHAHTLDVVCEGTLSPTLTTAHSTTNQHLGNFGERGHPRKGCPELVTVVMDDSCVIWFKVKTDERRRRLLKYVLLLGYLCSCDVQASRFIKEELISTVNLHGGM